MQNTRSVHHRPPDPLYSYSAYSPCSEYNHPYWTRSDNQIAKNNKNPKWAKSLTLIYVGLPRRHPYHAYLLDIITRVWISCWKHEQWRPLYFILFFTFFVLVYLNFILVFPLKLYPWDCQIKFPVHNPCFYQFNYFNSPKSYLNCCKMWREKLFNH